jgi:tetratricopeptide (TPR) repeat protein
MLVGASASVSPTTPEPPHAQAEAENHHTLNKALTLLDARDIDGAIVILDGVIQSFEDKYASEERRIYSARSLTETMVYMGMASAAKEPREAVVIGPEWTTAYHMKAYALIEKRDVSGARAALEKARALSPHNSLVISELAYTYQLTKDWARMLALYINAEHAADFSPETEQAAERSRALRGQGFGLIELNRLDEADAIFRKCLELDPDDNRAKNELDYISKLRRGAK